MNKKIAIKCHSTRGQEVIEILEMLGGKNIYNLSGDTSCAYYVLENGEIRCGEYVYGNEPYTILTLEEFLEKFPYKVGDKVQHKGATSCGSVFEVEKMRWDGEKVIYIISYLGGNCVSTVTAEDLQPYKEKTMNKAVFDANAQCCDIMNHLIKKETMEEKIESFENLESHCANEVKIEFDPSKFEMVKRDDGYYIVKQKTKYPRDFDECCEVLSLGDDGKGYKASLIQDLQKLLICRDAYWKIAGEQMELGKSWKPNWSIYEHKFCLGTDKDKVIEECVTTGNRILAFPTKEMRDAFFENFKKRIEQCKEFL